MQRDGPAMSTTVDDVAHLQDLRFAIAVMDHNTIKLDRSVLDANLQEAVTASGLADFNIVMIVLAVNMGLTQVNPVGCLR